MITYKTYKALKCLEKTKVNKPMSAHLCSLIDSGVTKKPYVMQLTNNGEVSKRRIIVRP